MEHESQNQPINEPTAVASFTPQPISPGRKIKLPIIVGGFVILLLIGIVVYYLDTLQNQSSSSLHQSTNSFPTISMGSIKQTSPSPAMGLKNSNKMKTYNNAKYKYSLNYPNDWDVKEFPASDDEIEVTSFNPATVTERLSAIFISVSSNSYDKESFGYGDPIKVGNYIGKKEKGGGGPNADIHLRVVAPLGTKSIIFESSTGYEKIFDDILSSFRITN